MQKEVLQETPFYGLVPHVKVSSLVTLRSSEIKFFFLKLEMRINLSAVQTKYELQDILTYL